MFQAEHLQEKWQPVLEHPDLPKIEDSYRRAVTTIILENQEKSLKEDKNFLINFLQVGMEQKVNYQQSLVVFPLHQFLVDQDYKLVEEV